MKALSLWQPWASLLAHGLKSVETRSWRMHHRGPLLIHAAKKWTPEIAMIALRGPFRSALEGIGVKFTESIPEAKRGWNLPFGCIVGMVDVVGCWPTEQVEPGSPDFSYGHVKPADPKLFVTNREIVFGDYSRGRFATLCVRARPFLTTRVVRGAQGLFEVDGEATLGIGDAGQRRDANGGGS